MPNHIVIAASDYVISASDYIISDCDYTISAADYRIVRHSGPFVCLSRYVFLVMAESLLDIVRFIRSYLLKILYIYAG